MGQKLTILFFLLFGFLPVFAKHITGGEIIYEQIGSNATSKTYKVILILFRDENCVPPCAAMPTSVSIGIFNNDNNMLVGGYRSVAKTLEETLPVNTLPLCITNAPDLVYNAGYYEFNVTLNNNVNGYSITYQTCCRIDGISNTGNGIGATYTAVIPGLSTMPANSTDDSPQFSKGISVVCYNRPFTLDFSATDADGDSLVYSLCDAFNGGAAEDAGFSTPAAPPYGSIPYTNGYFGLEPLGPLASINTATGIISGMAPGEGKYVVSVCVSSYRNGQFIAVHRKDFIVSVAPCDFADAKLLGVYQQCDGFTVRFKNEVNSPLNQSFFWDFGDGNTANVDDTLYTYSDTGTYRVKLVVNRETLCADSDYAVVRVYPGFFAGILENSPMCTNRPVQFNDSTVAVYGQVNYWNWNFGVAGTNADTSRLQSPAYAYSQAGTYNTRLIVASNKGCIDTVFKQVTILDKPFLKITNDTTICIIDTLQLNANTDVSGTIAWSPNYMIDNLSSFTPLVSPDVTTEYRAIFTDNYGCVNTDTVKITVVPVVTISAMADTTICRTDSIQLRIQSNGLSYSWTPPQTISNPAVANPWVTPVNNITDYVVTARVGKCMAQETIRVTTVPYPNANAGRDTSVCAEKPAYLHATGGSFYFWTPNLYLNSNQGANVISTPPEDVQYIVEVRDNKGCPKPTYDTVFVNVERVFADAGPRDTSVVLNQPLQLNATGGTLFNWLPNRWLNASNIADPVSLPKDSIEYIVRVSNSIGCVAYDTILVRLFNLEPGLYVPSAFTPGGDGRNDVFRPIALGIRQLDYFKVYDRWGLMVYSTSDLGRGWNGKYNSTDQPVGTYVWQVQATDYLGRKINKKGSVVLIR